MKKLMLLSITGILMVMVSCQGPEGPQGPQGPAGKDGEDGVAKCGACHNLSTDLYAKIIQYENSVHYLGGNFERNGTSCAICHTSQGFTERLATGADQTAAPIQDPVPVNCRTCHNIHVNYDTTDFNLVTENPVTLFHTGETLDIGEGNLCAMCHQARVPDPLPTPGGQDVTITSPYWGTHHGPQANIIAGAGGVEFQGSMSYQNSAHTTVVGSGCVKCHMADAYGNQAGGHQMGMTYDYHGHEVDNIAGCLDCHSDITDFDIDGKQTEIQTLLDSLSVLLTDKGILTSSGSLKPGTYSADVAGAYMNYQMIKEDRSLGVHNYKYTKALLVNTIEAIQ